MEPGRQESRRVNITVSSGSGSTTIDKIWSLSRRIRIIPPTEATNYTFSAYDADNHLIFKRSSVTGTYSEIDILSLGILSLLSVTSSTSDGDFIIKFDMH